MVAREDLGNGSRNPWKIVAVAVAVVAVPIGVLAVIAGEFDDSPGFQGLGVILVAASITLIFRLRRRGGTG